MAIIGTAEVEIRANTAQFQRSVEQMGSSGGILSKFTGFIDGADKSLAKFGLTSRDVSVILGAGLAGGVAFAGKAILDFGVQSVQAAARLEDAKNLAERVFEEQAGAVEEFAERASTSIGLSERAALAAVDSFGLFAKNLGLPVEAAANLGTSLTTLAADIASAQPDFVNIEDVLIALRAALRGERDPLERFGVTLTEAGVKAKAAELGIAGLGSELTSTQKLVASYALILEQTEDIQGDFADTADSLPNQMNTLSAATEDLKAAIGEVLLPTVITTVQNFNLFFKTILDTKRAIDDLVGSVDNSENAFGKISKFIRDTFTRSALGTFVEGLKALGIVSDDSAEGVDELTSAQDLAAQSADALASAEEKTTKELERMADARLRLNRALEDAELREDEAERDLAEAQEERAERIFDAQEALADARIEGFRKIRDARERLSDFEHEAERRIVDAERRIVQLRRQQNREILRSLQDVQSAQLAGDIEAENRARLALAEAQQSQEIHDAEIELEREKADQKREIARLERELAEARIEAADDVADAQRDLARTYDETAERVEDAQRRLEAAHRQSERAIHDARVAVDRLADELERAEKASAELLKNLKGIDIITDAGNAEGTIAPFAAGGRFYAGQTLLVGEQGPELIQAGTGGTVFSNDQMMAMMAAMLNKQGGPGRIDWTGEDWRVNRTLPRAMPDVTFVVNHQDPRILAGEVSWMLSQMVNW